MMDTLYKHGWPVCHGHDEDGLCGLTVNCDHALVSSLGIGSGDDRGIYDEVLSMLQADVDRFAVSAGFDPDEIEWRVRLFSEKTDSSYEDWEVPGTEGGVHAELLERIDIKLEAGWAFGNGTHPTTAGCIEALVYLDSKGMIKGRNVLDVGSGTGILSLMSAAFGACRVIAVDIDPESVKIAERNVLMNGFDDVICVRHASLSDMLPVDMDIITANLVPSVMHGIFDDMMRFAGSDTVVVASGFKKGRRDAMDSLFSETGFESCWETVISGWMSVIYKRS
jgi:ribosomal protein L11 methylase PrmA